MLLLVGKFKANSYETFFCLFVARWWFHSDFPIYIHEDMIPMLTSTIFFKQVGKEPPLPRNMYIYIYTYKLVIYTPISEENVTSRQYPAQKSGTLPETNIFAPENGLIDKHISFPFGAFQSYFQGRTCY